MTSLILSIWAILSASVNGMNRDIVEPNNDIDKMVRDKNIADKKNYAIHNHTNSFIHPDITHLLKSSNAFNLEHAILNFNCSERGSFS